MNSVNVMKTYVASVEATLVGQQFASEGGAAAHWAQLIKFEESVRDAAVIRVKEDTPIEAANRITYMNASTSGLAQRRLVLDIYTQETSANSKFKPFQTYFLVCGCLTIDSST